MRVLGSRWIGQSGSVLLLSLLAMVVLSLLGSALLTMSGSETFVSARIVYREGAFYAAEAGVHTGLDQLSMNMATSTQAIPVTAIGDWYAYRSGRRGGPGAPAFRVDGDEARHRVFRRGGDGVQPGRLRLL